MRRLLLLLSACLPVLLMTEPLGAADAKLLSWSQLQALPLPPPGERITYGPAPEQFGLLRLPAAGDASRRVPVVILIHGGCWQNEFDYVYITRLAGWLAERGLASWTIEYARLGDARGGWPGTFTDVGAAADALRGLAKTHAIDPTWVYAAGHSAGGQLALWLASRGHLAKSSELYAADSLPIRGVLGLAAITDLDRYRIGPPDSCNASVDPLLGGTPEQMPQRYTETSPLRRLPLGVPAVFVQGDVDPIVPLAGVRAYAEAATKAGDKAKVLTMTGAGHFDVVAPLPATTATLEQALKTLGALQ